MAGRKQNGEPGELHGQSRIKGNKHNPTYTLWCNMKARCQQVNNPSYKNYGGRGITVCERWRNSFVTFLADVGERPGPNDTLDRIENDRGYEPGNVRWATRQTQIRNSRVTKLTPEQVREIRALHTDGEWGYTAISRLFNVRKITIRDIVKQRSWKDLNV